MSYQPPQPSGENPYHAPGPELPADHLPKLHAKVLKNYLQYRTAGLTLIGMAPRMLLYWFFLAVICGSLLLVLTVLGSLIDEATFERFWFIYPLIIGMFFGKCVADIGYIRQFAAIWPVLKKYLNFEAMERDLYETRQ